MPARDRPIAARTVASGAGDIIGGYELLREVGRGGMAEVWVARRAHASAGKFVAIKLTLPQHAGDARYAGMFRSEAEVSAPLSHGNIVQVFDQGEDDGRSYLVMEWVDGVDLARLLPDLAQLRARDPYLRLRVAGYIVGQVLHGLSYAHKVTSHRGAQLGIVHRDISPQNVLVSVSGDVKVTDFGIAHRMIDETSGVDIKGKLRYMAPEQLGGQSHAPTVDLWAVGAVLHELLEGERFRGAGRDAASLYHQVLGGEVPQLAATDVPVELDAVRLALLHPDPRRRPQTADAALLLLKAWPGYSEMKVELAMLCGLATGVVRPRTGPLVEPGQPTVPPRGRGAPRLATLTLTDPLVRRGERVAAPVWSSSQVETAEYGVEPRTVVLAHAPGRPTDELAFGGARRAGADAAAQARDLEATHSAVGGMPPVGYRAGPRSDVAPVGHVAVGPSRWRRWLLVPGFVLLAVGGAVGTAWLMDGLRAATSERLRTDDDRRTAATDALSPSVPENIAVATSSPDVGLPVRAKGAPSSSATPVSDPVLDSGAEPTSAPLETPANATAVATPTARDRPRVSRQRRATPHGGPRPRSRTAALGPHVIVRFRLAGGLTGADVELGDRVISIRPHHDTRVASGRYRPRWRAAPEDSWQTLDEITIGAEGEWKFFVGPGGVQVSRM